MKKISCLIVDDQIESIKLIVDYIENSPQLFVKFSTTNPIDALNFIDSESVDCIFLDIEMPELTGLEFIEALKLKFGVSIPKIILTTGYSDYALSGYDYGVFDYLLKPISFKRFKISIDRLLNEFKKEVREQNEFFFADIDGQKIKIAFEGIIYIEGAGNYIYIVTTERKITYYKTLSSILEILPENKFIRVHKSFVVSLSNIKSIRGNEILIIANNSEKHIPIGGTFKEHFLKVLGITE